MQIIPLTDVLEIMKTTTQPFTLVVVTADRKRNKGGELLELTGLQAGVSLLKKKTTRPASEATANRNTRKNKNIRNVVLEGSGQIRKVNIRLIILFNGQLVRW